MVSPRWYLGARRVFVFPRLGIVVKVPRFYWQQGWSQFVVWCRLRGVIYSLHWTEDHPCGCRQFWTKGLRDNWREFLFFWRYRKPFLQPTLFSFFGLINIQRYGEVLTEDDFQRAGIWHKFLDLVGQEFLVADGHHFEKGENFCRRNGHGQLRMVDYGSRKTQEILCRWADQMSEKITL